MNFRGGVSSAIWQVYVYDLAYLFPPFRVSANYRDVNSRANASL
jgi:hypothetical protein